MADPNPAILGGTQLPNVLELSALVAKMMAKDRNDRYRVPTQIIAALKPYTANANLGELLQPAGKRILTIEEFLRGYPVKAGERFA